MTTTRKQIRAELEAFVDSFVHVKKYLAAVADDPHPCTYGHLNCASTSGGPCSDEMCALVGLENPNDA